MIEPGAPIAPVRTRQDPSLRAQVVACRPLLYDAGADPSQDRPAYVRAGSALALVGRRLVVLQDDTLFLGLVDLERGSVQAIALPAAPGGVRCFDEGRGNKAAKDLLRYLERGRDSDPLQVHHIVQYDLGTMGGVRLTFTDAAALGEDILYLAAAEASPDAVQDGPVAGVALGLIPAAGGPPRCTPLLDRVGRPFSGKAEGLAPDPRSPGTIHLVVDRDDPDAPAELCRVELEGFRL